MELDNFLWPNETSLRLVIPWELLLALHDVLSRLSPLPLQGQLQIRSNLNSVPSTFKLPHSAWCGWWESTEGLAVVCSGTLQVSVLARGPWGECEWVGEPSWDNTR